MSNKKKSTILRGMTRDGSARLAVINSKEMVNGMRIAHKTAPTATAALGRTITAASMIGTLLPDNGDTVTISFSGDGEADDSLYHLILRTPLFRLLYTVIALRLDIFKDKRKMRLAYVGNKNG